MRTHVMADLSWDDKVRGPMPKEGEALYLAYWAAMTRFQEGRAVAEIRAFLERHPARAVGPRVMDAANALPEVVAALRGLVKAHVSFADSVDDIPEIGIAEAALAKAEAT